jgi:hypothetical protein
MLYCGLSQPGLRRASLGAPQKIVDLIKMLKSRKILNISGNIAGISVNWQYWSKLYCDLTLLYLKEKR